MMRKIYCIICGKYRKFKKAKICNIFEKRTLLLSIIYGKCENEMKKYLEKKNKFRY